MAEHSSGGRGLVRVAVGPADVIVDAGHGADTAPVAPWDWRYERGKSIRISD